MGKTLRQTSSQMLQRQKAALLADLQIPTDLLRASRVRQYLTCGKKNCRCQRGHKHGPFQYFVQCVAPGDIQKFLLKTEDQRRHVQAGINSYKALQDAIEMLSRINSELLRRGLPLQSDR